MFLYKYIFKKNYIIFSFLYADYMLMCRAHFIKKKNIYLYTFT